MKNEIDKIQEKNLIANGLVDTTAVICQEVKN